MMTDPLPSFKAYVPYETRLEPPFVFIHQWPFVYLTDIDDLNEAVEAFVKYSLPAEGSKAAYVSDRNGVLAVGFIMVKGQDHPQWFGVNQGFRSLERQRFVDPLEVASAEIMARQLQRHG